VLCHVPSLTAFRALSKVPSSPTSCSQSLTFSNSYKLTSCVTMDNFNRKHPNFYALAEGAPGGKGVNHIKALIVTTCECSLVCSTRLPTMTNSTQRNQQNFQFLQLPAELRNAIYEYVFCDSAINVSPRFYVLPQEDPHKPNPTLTLLHVCSQLRHKTYPYFTRRPCSVFHTWSTTLS
jgi:hypothetical protein